ncbi:hypothetical protein DN390_10815 [Bacillus sp. SH7-1]|nr:hypothetical protein DN390_10815 [Bacillus sp. SH7-1]
MDMKPLLCSKTQNVILSNTICTSITNNINDFREKGASVEFIEGYIIS